MRTFGRRGSPTTISPSALRSASSTSVTRPAGTSAFLMAVHFWPAFTVISRTTSRTNSSSSGVPAPASGPSTEELSESVSEVKRTELALTTGCWRSFSAVAAEPVNDTTSWQVRCSNRSPTPPQMSCTAPSGRIADSTIRLNTRSVR